jgi:hypothetical protein
VADRTASVARSHKAPHQTGYSREAEAKTKKKRPVREARRLREYNDCNLPPGEDGGRFGANSDPRCGGGRTGTPLPEYPKPGEKRPDYFSEPEPAHPDDHDFERWGNPEHVSAARIREHLLALEEDYRERIVAADAIADEAGAAFEIQEGTAADNTGFLAAQKALQQAYGDTVVPRFPLHSKAGEFSETGTSGEREARDMGEFAQWLSTATPAQLHIYRQYQTAGKMRQQSWDEVLQTTEARDALKKEFTDQSRALLALPETLRLGGSNISAMVIGNGKADAEARAIVRDAKDRLLSATDFLGSMLHRSQWGHLYPEELLLKSAAGRAYADPKNGSIAINTFTDPAVIVHELAHHLEFVDKETLQAAVDFRASRFGEKLTSPRKPGEKRTQKLQELFPDNGYDDHEEVILGSKEHFSSAYAGKVYSGVAKTGSVRDRNGIPHYATEIVSMGFQQLFADPAKFAKEDPDWFDFTVDLARRGPRKAIQPFKKLIPPPEPFVANPDPEDRVKW